MTTIKQEPTWGGGFYHQVTEADCQSVATPDEKKRLDMILDIFLYKTLAQRWCTANKYRLDGYLGSGNWATTTSTT